MRLRTYSRVRGSAPIRTTQIMCKAQLASRFPPRFSRCLTTLPEDASQGRHATNSSEGGLIAQTLGIVSRGDEKGGGVVRADSRQGEQPGCGVSHKPGELPLELSDLLGQGFVAAGHRAKGELGGALQVGRIAADTKTSGDSGKFLCSEPMQLLAEILRSRDKQALELVGRLAPCLDRGAPGRSEGSDHLDLTIWALGLSHGLAGENGASSRFRV